MGMRAGRGKRPGADAAPATLGHRTFRVVRTASAKEHRGAAQRRPPCGHSRRSACQGSTVRRVIAGLAAARSTASEVASATQLKRAQNYANRPTGCAYEQGAVIHRAPGDGPRVCRYKLATMVKVGGNEISLDQGINLAVGAAAVIDGAACMLAPNKAQVRAPSALPLPCGLTLPPHACATLCAPAVGDGCRVSGLKCWRCAELRRRCRQRRLEQVHDPPRWHRPSQRWRQQLAPWPRRQHGAQQAGPQGMSAPPEMLVGWVPATRRNGP